MAEDTNTDPNAPVTTAGAETAPQGGKKLKVQAPATPAIPEGHVLVRVTKYGSGKVHRGGTNRDGTGEGKFNTEAAQDPESGYEIFPTYKAGEFFTVHRKIAVAQEALGNVEIQDEDEAA